MIEKKKRGRKVMPKPDDYYQKKKKNIFRTKVRIVFDGYVDIDEVFREDAIEKAVGGLLVSIGDVNSIYTEREGFCGAHITSNPKKITAIGTKRRKF